MNQAEHCLLYRIALSSAPLNQQNAADEKLVSHTNLQQHYHASTHLHRYIASHVQLSRLHIDHRVPARPPLAVCATSQPINIHKSCAAVSAVGWLAWSSIHPSIY